MRARRVHDPRRGKATVVQTQVAQAAGAREQQLRGTTTGSLEPIVLGWHQVRLFVLMHCKNLQGEHINLARLDVSV